MSFFFLHKFLNIKLNLIIIILNNKKKIKSNFICYTFKINEDNFN